MKILVNTISTKKHAGGAFQISQNFLLETLSHPEVDWYYATSKDVDDAIGDKFADIKGKRYFVFPTQPDFKHTYWDVRKQLKTLEQKIAPDVVYSITAPCYFTFKSTEVMRFTMPWVTHPNSYSWSILSTREKLSMRIYCWNQRRMMRKAKYFITQTETTRQGILRITGSAPENVQVVKNVLPSIFSKIESTPLPVEEGVINIACVGNPSAHKNFDIVPNVLAELRDLGIANVYFHLTIPEDSPRWAEIKSTMSALGLEDGIVNHGRISQKEMADMYRHCQFCFLPTLLEVFSASTVEAMYFHLPVVATDFDFNREVMGDACLYYEPMNAKAAALQLKRFFDDVELQKDMKLKMEQRLSLFGDYEKHFHDILSFLEVVAKKK